GSYLPGEPPQVRVAPWELLVDRDRPHHRGPQEPRQRRGTTVQWYQASPMRSLGWPFLGLPLGFRAALSLLRLSVFVQLRLRNVVDHHIVIELFKVFIGGGLGQRRPEGLRLVSAAHGLKHVRSRGLDPHALLF